MWWTVSRTNSRHFYIQMMQSCKNLRQNLELKKMCRSSDYLILTLDIQTHLKVLCCKSWIKLTFIAAGFLQPSCCVCWAWANYENGEHSSVFKPRSLKPSACSAWMLTDGHNSPREGFMRVKGQQRAGEADGAELMDSSALSSFYTVQTAAGWTPRGSEAACCWWLCMK